VTTFFTLSVPVTSCFLDQNILHLYEIPHSIAQSVKWSVMAWTARDFSLCHQTQTRTT